MPREKLKRRVLALVAAIEPDYEAGRRLARGRKAKVVKILDSLLGSPDRGRAVRAVYFAAHLGGRRAARLVSKAARSPRGPLRIAAAASLDLLPAEDADRLAAVLIGDLRDDVAFNTVRAVLRMERAERAPWLASVAAHHRARHVREEASSAARD